MNPPPATTNSPSYSFAFKPQTRDDWDSSEFPTLPTAKDLCQRIRFVLQKLREEPHLPAELQQQIVSGCTRILATHRQGRLTPSEARHLVENLASTSFRYDELTLQSSTLCQIRTLDLELNDILERIPAEA